jgi:hypothetical protein
LLPAEWVARIFTKLTVRYGQAFTRRWDGIELQDVHEDWAEQLARFRRRPDCIAYALDNLPADKPPTVGEFRALCNAMPERSETLRIEHKRGPIPAAVMKSLDRLKEPLEISGQYQGHRGWAYRLRDREEQGDKLSPIQRRFWREALGAA